MSTLLEQDIVCPYCQFPDQAELWASINVKDDPELKDLLLGGELNMVECASCKEMFYADRFLLYHDPENELMAFVYPIGHRAERERWLAKTRTDFEQIQNGSDTSPHLNYGPLSLFGLDELVTLVEWDDEIQVQGEIVKALSQENDFPVQELRPSVARFHRLPRVLPLLKGSVLQGREALLAGIGALETINDRLFVYAEAKKRLLENPAFDVPAA